MHRFSQQWRIHIGAHKTATTHIQDILATRRVEFASHGVDYLDRDRLRLARLASSLRPETGLIKGSLLVRKWRSSRKMDVLRASPRRDRILISEEQFIGLSDGILGSVFYPEAEQRIHNLRRLLNGAPTTLLLSIRNPANIIPSAYSQCLRAGARGIPTLGQVREQALSQPPSWTHLVRRIRVAFPEAQLVVWRFEDYIANPGPYLDLISGTRLGNWPELASPESTRSLSAETVERILALETTLSRKERIARCAELAASDRGVRRFQPFSPEDITRLTQAYEADLAEMEREFPGVLHRLGT